VHILYFFFRDSDKTTAADMLASLIDQLVMLKTDLARLITILKNSRDNDNSECCRSFDKLRTTFFEMLRGFPVKVLILLDALDECQDRNCHKLAGLLSTLTEVSTQVLITSRVEHDISKIFASIAGVLSVGMEVDDDIQKFVQRRVTLCHQLQGFKERIISTVPKKSEGMFRYAALMINELDLASTKDIADVLGDMPDGLNGMYELILLRLHERQPRNAQIQLRKTILLWVAIVYRPVRVDEMAYACATKAGEKDFDPNNKRLATSEDILSACGSLIDISNNNELRFTHASVKDFLCQSLEKSGVKNEAIKAYLVCSPQAHTEIALSCSMYNPDYLLSVQTAN